MVDEELVTWMLAAYAGVWLVAVIVSLVRG